jgi:hypothetical protein
VPLLVSSPCWLVRRRAGAGYVAERDRVPSLRSHTDVTSRLSRLAFRVNDGRRTGNAAPLYVIDLILLALLFTFLRRVVNTPRMEAHDARPADATSGACVASLGGRLFCNHRRRGESIYRARARVEPRTRSPACASTYASSRRRIIRWYCVSPFAAADLKNSTLFLLSVIVIFTSSSRNASSCGDGRKSRTTLGFPIGSFVYLIFALIDSLSLAPVTSTNYPNNTRAMRESNGQYTTRDTPKAEVSPLLAAAVPGVLSDNAVGSANACCASTNGTPCLLWFSTSLRASHSKLGFGMPLVYCNQSR